MGLDPAPAGPLRGVRIVEVGGIGPVPFAAMVLADLGAEILRIDRPGDGTGVRDVLHRGRRSVGVDLKTTAGAEAVLRLVERSDALVEGYRPGVMERLGLGPDACLARNSRLVYGRMTGWGQDGPYRDVAGHDINYIALAGALDPIGRAGCPPTPPLNLVGDFGGGSMFLALGVVAAILESRSSGAGQVVDAAVVDGAALMMSPFRAYLDRGEWSGPRGTNYLDSGSPMYDVYECADGRYVSVGALEPQFWTELRRLAGLAEDPELDKRDDPGRWPELKTRLAAVFRTRTRDEWCALLEHSDACFAPVLTMAEAPTHPHNVARETFVDAFGELQAAPAPRFSRTPGAISRRPPLPGEDTDSALRDWGWTETELADLRASGALGGPIAGDDR